MPDLSRRDFLKLARAGFLYLSGALSFGGLFRFLGFEPNPAPQTEFDAGSAENYPLGSQTSLPNIPALLVHAESGFTALSLTCTHLGCALEQTTDGFTCPCHASRYDKNGNVTHGPAAKSLRQLRVEVTAENHLLVHLE